MLGIKTVLGILGFYCVSMVMGNTVQAQSEIVGKWVSDHKEDVEGSVMMTIGFSEDGTVQVSVDDEPIQKLFRYEIQYDDTSPIWNLTIFGKTSISIEGEPATSTVEQFPCFLKIQDKDETGQRMILEYDFKDSERITQIIESGKMDFTEKAIILHKM